MKFYVTGRSNNYSRVEEAFTEVKKRGHEATFEWTTLPMAKPYSENQERAKEYATLGIQGVVDADVYIIFAHGDGNGVFTEFGAALATNAIKNSPRIFAIGSQSEHCMFNYHPAVEWQDNLQGVFSELGI